MGVSHKIRVTQVINPRRIDSLSVEDRWVEGWGERTEQWIEKKFLQGSNNENHEKMKIIKVYR